MIPLTEKDIKFHLRVKQMRGVFSSIDFEYCGKEFTVVFNPKNRKLRTGYDKRWMLILREWTGDTGWLFASNIPSLVKAIKYQAKRSQKL